MTKRRHVQIISPEIMADYTGVQESRNVVKRTGYDATGTNADYHIRNESAFYKLIEQARDLDNNDMVIGQGITRLTQNIVQNGIQLDQRIPNEAELNAALVEAFNDFVSDKDRFDIAGKMNLWEAQAAVCRQIVVDGDHFVMHVGNGRVQFIEAHRVRTPSTKDKRNKNVVAGVEIDDYGRQVAIWMTAKDIDPMKSASRQELIRRDVYKDGTRVVLHPYIRRRCSMTRGISSLGPAMTSAAMLSDVQFAKLVQQHMSSMFVLIRERQLGSEPPAEADRQYGERDSETYGDGTEGYVEGLSPGMELATAPGETIKGFSPNIPNPEYFDHVNMLMEIISINLGIPVSMFTLDMRNRNFSSARMEIEQARMGMKAIQRMLIDDFLQYVYRWIMPVIVLGDPAFRKAYNKLGDAIYKHVWIPPKWDYIQPLDDAKADALIIKTRLNSARQVLAKRGDDIDTVNKALIADNVALITSAIEAKNTLLASYPEEQIDWREIAGFDIANSTYSMSRASDDKTDGGVGTEDVE